MLATNWFNIFHLHVSHVKQGIVFLPTERAGIEGIEGISVQGAKRNIWTYFLGVR
jgi:hypothetical protein